MAPLETRTTLCPAEEQPMITHASIHEQHAADFVPLLTLCAQFFDCLAYACNAAEVNAA